jgi:hypothetical protein
LLPIETGDEHKLAFRNRYDPFERMVMQLGTTHTPADFQGYITNGIREAVNDFASAYMHDVLKDSDSKGEHVGHVTRITQRLLEAGLYLNPEQCEFHQETVRYLDWNISRMGISMHEDKVKTV